MEERKRVKRAEREKALELMEDSSSGGENPDDMTIDGKHTSPKKGRGFDDRSMASSPTKQLSMTKTMRTGFSEPDT